MKIQTEEKSINGGSALGVLGAFVSGIVLFNLFTGSDPLENAELQASLREDVTRYLVSSQIQSAVSLSEDALRVSSSSSDANLIQANMNKFLNPTILSFNIKKNTMNLLCTGDYKQYDVNVRFKTVVEESADLRYCLNNRQHWTRASSFQAI